MAQLSISFGFDFGNLPLNKQVNVKVAHRSSITAKVSDWNDDDLYEDIEDFDVTDQSWRSIVARY
ncbi:MAG: hypothetical protein KBS70_07650 [Bacteroidales bacterium]|nr:hypothetical protein [Candidatus Colicola caccequi]MBQ0154640.1 hypothetical protein [Candidatus Colicola equi]